MEERQMKTAKEIATTCFIEAKIGKIVFIK
jgi:hypothetical protein